MKVLREIPQDEIAELDAMAKRCHELHVVPPTMATLEMEVTDKNGVKIMRYADLSRSWTLNYYNLITCQSLCCSLDSGGTSGYQDGCLRVRDTGGTIKGSDSRALSTGGGTVNFTCWDAGYGYRAAVSIVTSGIRVGSGTNAESISDYALQTAIANGTGAGQLSHAAMDYTTPSWNAGTRKWSKSLVRAMTNASGNNVSVNEACLIARTYTAGADVYLTFLRDKLDATITLSDADVLIVTYTLYSAAYPE